MENEDQQPASGSNLKPDLPDQEGLKPPSNPAETSVDEALEQPSDGTQSPAEAAPLNHSAEGAEFTPPAARDSADNTVTPEISTTKEPPDPRKRLAYQLFSPETPLGRVMRPVLRWLAAITGLFALGLLAGYLLLYQPTLRALETAQANLAATSQIVSQKAQGLESAQTGLDQAQLSLKQVQNKLDAAASENALLIVMVDISNARVALVAKDGAAAKAAIDQAQSKLNQALPYIQSQDKVLSDLLQSRLDLSAKELVSDPQAALSDLGKLSSDLASLHQKIFGK